MIKFIVALVLPLFLWLLTGIVLISGAVIAAFSLQLWLDLPQENNFLVTGAALAAVAGGGIWISRFHFRGRGVKIFIAASALIWIFSVAYSVFYRPPVPWEYVGSDFKQVEKIYRSTPHPPPFLFTIGEETRSVRVLTADRPVTFPLNRGPDDPVIFGMAVTDPASAEAIIEVNGVISAKTRVPILTTPRLKAGGWNNFVIPSGELTPLLKSIEITVKKNPGSAVEPWVLISEPCFPKRKPGPNVVLVVVDTLRADQVNESNAPFLSGFSARSVVFREATAASSWTVPATTSILTGLYPNQHGYISNAHLKFNPGVEFLARQFQKSGYRTAAVTANILVDPHYGFANGFDDFISLGRRQRFYWNSGRILNLKARDWISRNGDSSFFLYLHYMDPHFPYLAPWPYTFHNFRGGILKKAGSLVSFFAFDFQDFTNRWPMDHPGSVPGILARYQGEVRYWDSQFEDMMRFLDGQGLLQNTVVVVVADHGESFGEHGNFRHGSSLFQEEIHVPMIVYDGRNPRGLVVADPVSAVEISSILSGMAGIPRAGSWVGRTMADFSSASPPPGRTCFSLLSYRHFHPINGIPESLRVSLSARNGNDKVILQYDDRSDKIVYLLYRLDRDPLELNNLWETSPKLQLPLYQEMTAFLPNPKSMVYAAPAEGYRQKARELRALGYIK